MCIPRSCDYNVIVRHVQPPLYVPNLNQLQMASEDVCTLHAITGELIEDPLNEEYPRLSGGVLTPNMQEFPAVPVLKFNFNELVEPEPFSDIPLEGAPPPIDCEDDTATAGAKSVNRMAPLLDNSPVSRLSSIGSIGSLLSFTSDSEDRFPEGQEEDSETRSYSCIELPSAKEMLDSIFDNEDAKAKFKQAYFESFPSDATIQERGGWAFVDQKNPTEILLELAPESASDVFLATDTKNPSIDLENISTDNVPLDYILAATFHTHPLECNEEPSQADINNAYHRGMPGIVISRRKIFGYGPERRTNTNEPHEYAPPVTEGKNMRSRKLRNNSFPLPSW